ncbi:MAG: CRISPR-associated protein Cas5 [Methanosarcinales archaeon Met12]|nr:MAG: CRISPR-associated protein Cas5 [Methanosarcinales archaeon Met12]
MKLLKIDLNIPFWCSFAEYGTMNIQQTYPFPPPPTIFGMILNALGKPAVHTIDDTNAKQWLIKEYLCDYSKLRFSIVVRDMGEKIDDYLNILKGNRKIEEEEANLEGEITKKIELFGNLDMKKQEVNKIANELKRQNIKNDDLKNIMDTLKQKGATVKETNELFDFIKQHWRGLPEKVKYEIRKYWLRSQVNRQRLIRPRYTIYIHSLDGSGDYSLNNLSFHLRTPKRLLYLGESDGIVDVGIEGDGLVEVEDENDASSQISSVLPGVYQNSQLVKMPVKLRYDSSEKHKLLCSVPYGDIGEEVSCINVCGEYIVFL